MLINPKFEKDEERDEPAYVSRKVLKVWNDEGHENVRPTEITVQLLKDGEVHSTQTLNAQNSWRYTWEQLDASSRWLVVENEPEHYTVSISQEGITFRLENRWKPAPTPTPVPPGEETPTPTPEPTPTPTPKPTSKPTPTPTPKPPTLPQTGQMWWPVPVLLCAGLMLIVIGLLRRRSAEYEE